MSDFKKGDRVHHDLGGDIRMELGQIVGTFKNGHETMYLVKYDDRPCTESARPETLKKVPYAGMYDWRQRRSTSM
jgi:hypothetical protein